MKRELLCIAIAVGWLVTTGPSAAASQSTTTAGALATTSTTVPEPAAAGEADPAAAAAPDAAAGAAVGADADRSGRFARVLEVARAQGAVRVLVRVGEGFTQEGSLSAQARDAQRAGIAVLQQAVLDSVAGARGGLLARYRTIPYLALEVDETAVETLRSLSVVTDIEEDLLLQPSLASSAPAIGVPQAWAAGLTGANQAIAILDTGVDKAHPFFKNGKVVSEACYSSAGTSLCPGGVAESTAVGSGVNCSTYTYGSCFHGSHVAGIAAGNDGLGPNIGVAKDAKIISIQVFSGITDCGYGQSPCLGASSVDLIKALERVLALRTSFAIAAVNLSLGGGTYVSSCDWVSSAMKTVIDNLRSFGIAAVIASGNDGWIDGISFPACISSAVSVGAVNDSGVVAYFSNVAKFLSLVAPGVSIRSATPGGSTVIADGTSMAAPHVAGAWALYKQRYPQAGVTEALSALRSSAVVVRDQRPGGVATDLRRIDVAGIGSTSKPPSGLTATAVSTTRIDLAWADNSSDESGFKIERKTGSAGSYGQIATVAAGVKVFANTGLTGLTTYCYRVRASSASGDSAYSNEACATTRDSAGIPAAPSNLSAANASATQIDLAWSDNSSNETGFKIERKIGSPGAYTQIAAVGAGVKVFANASLLTGTTYCYRVRAYNASGDSQYSAEVCAIARVPDAIPAAPSKLSAANVSVTQINLSWADNSSNETGFRIERKTGSSGTYTQIATVLAGVGSYANTALLTGTTYCYRVRAYNASGSSAYSNEICAVAQAPGIMPAPPSNLTATNASSTQINLAWNDNSSNETGFKIERKSGSTGTYAQVAIVTAGVKVFANTPVVAGSTYCYRVRAYNAAGNSAYTNEACALAQAPGTAPAAPADLSATGVSSTRIDATWSDNSANEAGFKIERKTGAAGAYAQIATVLAGVKAYANTDLVAGTTYCYRVRAYNAWGNSAYSNEACAVAQSSGGIPAAPSNLTAAAVSSAQANLAWSDNSSNETGFKIERKVGATGVYYQIAVVGAAVKSFVNTALLPSRTYCYRVKAYNGSGDSAYSNEKCVTTPAAASRLLE